jgi:hypothetical protein
VHGTGGTVVTRNVLIQSFEVGGNGSLVRSVVTGKLDQQYQEDPPVAGLLGVDYLDHFDIEIDVPNHRMALWRLQNCTRTLSPGKFRISPSLSCSTSPTGLSRMSGSMGTRSRR